ncbi:MAG TPA: hemolysin family protein, partial [Trueperaceae bacterium]
MSEIAVVSSRKVRLQQLANQGSKEAAAALELAENPNRFLSTVQIGITLVGIFAGAYGGATLSEPLAAALKGIPAIAPYAGGLSLAIVVAVITYLSLVIGELVPKRLGLNNPEGVAMRVARFMNGLSVAASPFVWLLSVSTDALLTVFRAKENRGTAVSEEEIAVLIEQGTRAGVFHEAEQDIVENVFWLADRKVGTIMTPRPDIVWLDLDDSPEAILEKITTNRHSQFAVGRGSLDNVAGFVAVRDLLIDGLAGLPLDLEGALQRPLYLPESMPALQVLERFRETGVHFALVVDEYGGIEGLVTLVDVLEALVGDLPALGETEEPLATQREDGSWLLDGLLSTDDFKELLDISELPREDTGDYRTVGGFVITYLGHIPAVGERFEWSGLRFEIVDLDGSRVDKVLVSGGAEELEASSP